MALWSEVWYKRHIVFGMYHTKAIWSNLNNLLKCNNNLCHPSLGNKLVNTKIKVTVTRWQKGTLQQQLEFPHHLFLMLANMTCHICCGAWGGVWYQCRIAYKLEFFCQRHTHCWHNSQGRQNVATKVTSEKQRRSRRIFQFYLFVRDKAHYWTSV